MGEKKISIISYLTQRKGPLQSCRLKTFNLPLASHKFPFLKILRHTLSQVQIIAIIDS